MPLTNSRRFWRSQNKVQRSLVSSDLSAIECLERRMMLSATASGAQQTWADLPAAAQSTISSDIGQDQSAYHVASGAAGVTLTNPANSFSAQLQSGALQISAGTDTWDMTLAGLGYGAAVQPVGTSQTAVDANRVDNGYASVDEWYVNGPNGLEQGFTVSPSQTSGMLTVELTLGGDLTGTVNTAGTGLMLSRPDGSAALTYTGLAAYDATGKALPATMLVQNDAGHQELFIQVNDAGAQGPITIDPWVQIARLTASDGTTGDFFGDSVAISNNMVVVGAPDATVGVNSGEGEAYVFTAPTAGWASMTQTAILTESKGAAGDNFGASVAINGNTVVVGADFAAVGNTTEQGEAFVFSEPASGGWVNMTQTAKLTASDGAMGDLFGDSVSISGTTVVVGAQDATIGSCTQQGTAYIFTKSGSTWTQSAKLTASDGNISDEFGTSVSISGSTVVVGAEFATVGNGTAQGAAYVFVEPGTTWTSMTETGKLTSSGTTDDAFFGCSVAISGNTAVIGAAGANAAYVFTKPKTGWATMTQTGKLVSTSGTAGSTFGSAVAISGNMVAVVGGNMGYIFAEPVAGWGNMTQTAQFQTSDGFALSSIGISGNTTVVGAPSTTINGNTEQGAAYIESDAIISVTPAGNQTATAGQSQTFTLGNFTEVNATATYTVDVNWGDGTADNKFIVAGPGVIQSIPHTYSASGNETVTITIVDSAWHSSNIATFNVDVALASPTFLGLTPSFSIAQGTAAAQFSGTIAAGTFFPPNTEDVAITLNGVTQNALIGSHGNFSMVFSTAALAASGSPYQVTYAYAGDANFNPVTDNTTTKLTVTPPALPTPAFGNLTVSFSVPQATTTAAFGGSIAAGASIPPDTESVAITLNSVTQNAPISAQGVFTTTFNISALPASNTPYQVTYTYAGDSNFNSVTDNTTTTLLVMPTNGTETPVYRLYSQITKEHLYTADLNEYNTLGTEGWDQEGLAYNDYTGLATVGGVTTEPLYRLYNISTKQHLWTTDPNEYNTLKNFVGTWSVDGISGYIFPANGNTSPSLAAVPGSAALYRMSWPFDPSEGLHLWTTDLNEYNTDAATYGWTKEGVIGYVM